MDVIASKVMAVMASETLASEAASLTSSEGVAKEISSDLSELAESRRMTHLRMSPVLIKQLRQNR